MKKKLSPLVVLTICAICIVGGLAAWIWSSPSLTYDYIIAENLAATTNFEQSSMVGIRSYQDLKAACVSRIFEHDSQYIIRVASNGGNIDQVFTSLTLSLPGASTATATVHTVTYIDGVIGVGENLGAIAIDGSESVQVTHSGSATWFVNSDYSTGKINALYFLISIQWDSALSVGTHQASALVRLGS